MRGYTVMMKRKAVRANGTLVPHPDDARAVRDALDRAERGELLSARASEKIVSDLLGEPWPPKKNKKR